MTTRQVQSGKTVFSMFKAESGQWAGKWIINNERTGRPHLILDSEGEASAAMDGIEAAAQARSDLNRN